MMSYTQKISKGYAQSKKIINSKTGEVKWIFDTTEGVIPKKIYFAHPFDKWRTPREEMIERFLKDRDYEVINPFKQESKLNEKYGVDNYYESPTIEFARDIVDKDRMMVLECDEYFGWFPKGVTMIGTPIELMWARELKMKITCLCYKPQPFLWMYSDVFYTSYKDFVTNKPFWVKE